MDAPKPVTTIPVLRSPRAWAVFAGVTVVGVVLDLGSKRAAFETVAGTPVRLLREDVLRVANPSMLIPGHEPVVVIPKLLELILVANPGAVFGMGAGRRVVFMVFTALAMAFALYLFAKWTTRRDWWSHAGLGLLVAGGLGNLYDRIVFGCVRDFLHPLPGMTLPNGWRWPWGGTEVWPYVSNGADLFLIIGIVMLGWRSFRPLKDGTVSQRSGNRYQKQTAP